MNLVGDGVSLGSPVIQYDETDWVFLKRLASHFNTVVACDIWDAKPKLYFGMPKGKRFTLPEETPYMAGKDLLAFQRAGGYEAGLHDTDFFYYEIESTLRAALGDTVQFRGKSMVVSEVRGRMDRGLFMYTYRLSRSEGIHRQRTENAKLTGISLEGEVLAVQGEQVKLHLNVDKEQSKGEAHWYPFAPATGNAMYCMPKVGTHASLYVPDATGARALVVGCVRNNGGSCEKTSNPSNRYFGTEHGSEVELLPTAINVVSGNKEPLKLSIDDATGITLTSHKKLTLNADEEISIFTPKRVIIKATSQLMANKLGKLSGFAIENEYHFLGDHVMAEGTDQTSYPPYDDEPKEGTPPPPPPPPPKKKFSWGSLLGNVVAGLAVVVAVAVVAAVTVATLGAGAVVIGAVVVGAMAAGTIAVGSRAVSDIVRGEVSSTWDYMTDAFRESMIGAASGAIFGPFAAGARVAGQMVVGGVTGVFENVVSQLTDNRKGFSWDEVLFSGGVGFLFGGVLDVKIARRTIGDYLGSGIGKITPDWLKRGFGSILDGFGSAVQGLSKWGSNLGGKFLTHIQDLNMKLGIKIIMLDDKLMTQLGKIDAKLDAWTKAAAQTIRNGFQLPGSQVVIPGYGRVSFDDYVHDPHVNRSDSGSGWTSNPVHRSEVDEVIRNDYDINGNLINRSVVPKGFESVDDFLSKVDDVKIKDYGYDSIDEFKETVKFLDEYLNKSPKNNILNKSLAGGVHNNGVKFDILGFPIFKGENCKFEMKLPESKYKASDPAQFKECTKALKKAIEEGKVPKELFTDLQLKYIMAEKDRIPGLTWHHHQVPGKMQLVPTDVHKANHLGGNSLWGDGIR
ncbi:hypothetical protein PAECIP111893_01794 [Paenibacillus plantiphilus]|uniref:DNase/tRNase domain of colicin-like bacteriocin n=1 Tax=Paenibacillus plantiphilus TaxID=2905650 RepID=A0ABM9C5N7_9BACL|nr:hypothetical protein PAECIP111893_01794 [Paenibacillus plantiphilus]